MGTGEKLVNKRAVMRLQEKAERTLEAVMRQGFYGSVTLEVSLVDGLIRSIRTRVEEQEVVGKGEGAGSRDQN
ncbi:MAG TPA: hypothetical protein ACFYEA_06040 [Candidatus Tripitaka californicus]|nr:hypothetical protein [Planctomycetota bacterium]